MRHLTLIAVILLVPTGATAQRPLRHVLFDFEHGIDAWNTNVWGGAGEVELSMAEEPKFGSGALHSEVIGVEKGGNTIGPILPAEAAWRAHEWGVISLWFRGDGTPTRAKLTVHTGDGEDLDYGYSFNLPMDSTEWRRISAPVGAFWNREKVPMDTRRIARIYIGSSGTHSFEVDQITLEAPQRPVPMTQTGGDDLDVMPELLQFGDGRHGLRFDPAPLLPGPAVATARFTLPDGEHEVAEQIPGATAEEEVLLVCPATQESGEATVTLTVARGQDTASATWRFDAVANRPLPDPTRLSLLPAPKECELREGAFALDEGSVECVGEGDYGTAFRVLQDTLAEWGVQALTRPTTTRELPAGVLLIGEAPDVPDALRHTTLPAGGYVLTVGEGGARIAGADGEGIRNGVITLLQAAESHYALTGERAIPAMHVVDWPSLPIRAVSLPLPNNRWGYPNDPPADPDMFLDFMREVVVQTKLNMAVLIIHQAMQYESHPIVAGPAAWPKEEVKRVFDTLRSWGVEPVPHMNSLGHMNWLCIPYRDIGLAEDGDVHQICTSHPDAERIVKEIYQEIIDLVRPRYFHVGLDEIRWKTHTLPEEERCPLCAGKSKQDIFVEWVTMLHDFLSSQDVQMMMWGDMILPGHNGGPPYNLAETVDRLPKDVIIANWSTGLTPESHKWLLDRGFKGVIKSNSRGATLAEQQLLMGNMFGCWYKVPWLTEQTLPKLEGNAYGSFLAAAEYSWNHWPDLFHVMPPVTAEFFAERPLVQWRIGADPVTGGELTAVELPEGEPVQGLPEGALRFGCIAFTVRPERALRLEPGGEATIAVGREARALYLLHAAELLDREAVVEDFKDPSTWAGVPIAEYVVSYESGETETIPVRYGMELRDPEEGWCRAPIAYSSLGVHPMTCDAEGLHLYAMQWRNPRPDDAIASVTVRQLDAPARVVLAGMAAQ